MRRVLLDECVDERLRHRFLPHEYQTARHAGLAGLKNGDLLTAAEHAGFDVIVTFDRKMPSQQNWAPRQISVLVLCGGSNRLSDIEKLVPEALAAIAGIGPGRIFRVPQ